MVARRLLRALARRRPSAGQTQDKAAAELAYWRDRQATEGRLGGSHYFDMFTVGFGLDRSYFTGRRIVDLGCGPRGSLEWATGTSLRAGVDPLALAYRELGTAAHQMQYVCAGAEALPFATGSVDIVSCLNALDHVDDLDLVIGEITRVVRAGGALLLVTEVGHEPTPTEPLTFGFDVVDRLVPAFRVEHREDFEMSHALVHASVLAAVPYDHGDGHARSGVLRARLVRSH